MTGFNKVLVAFGSDPLDGSLLLALRELARAPGLAEVHAVTVHRDTGEAAAPQRFAERLEKEVRHALEGVAAPAIVTAVLDGPVLDALLAYLERHTVDLAIVGHRRTDRSRSLARRLARHAPCSILMVPDGAPPRFGHVLVPVDFSRTSTRTLDAALSLCKALGLSECHALNVISRSDRAHQDEEPLPPGMERAAIERMMTHDEPREVALRFEIEDADDVAAGVHAVATRLSTGLICMGARGRSRAAAVLLGSATEDVLERVGCPVLVVRDPGRPLSLLDVLVQRVFTEEDRPRPI